MSLAQVYSAGGPPAISMELFPPKTVEGEASLMRHVEQLRCFRPRYITCTYGAGGSTRDKTLAIVAEVKRRFGIPVASHLTCVGSSVDELRNYLRSAIKHSIDHIVALRGDPPQGSETFEPAAGGLRYANELVTLIRGEFPSLGIAVAGYPEVHREAPSADVDLLNLRRKVDAGADVVITQLFYHNDDFFRFRDRCVALGIRVPIVPGILPVTNLAQIQRITQLCGARLPALFVRRLAEHEDPEWHMQVGVEHATAQVQELIRGHVPGLHFYILNKADATSAVLRGVEGLA